MAYVAPSLRNRILRRHTVNDDGCWIWTGAKSGSGDYIYGIIYRAGSSGSRDYAHRIAYEEFIGPIPEGTEIDHTCEVTLCVNPEHLEAVTHKENVQRAYRGR